MRESQRLIHGLDEPRQMSCSLRSNGWGLAFVLGIGAFLFVSCKSGPASVRVIESEVIDSLLAAAPQTLIDTDALNEEIWFPDAALAEMRDSLVLGSVFSFTIARDSLYLADFMAHNIFAAGLQGPLQRQIGRMGEAPQEFQFPTGPYFNGTNFFVIESGRIQVLSRDGSHVGVIRAQEPSRRPFRDAAITATRLYVRCPHGAADRICPYQTKAPFLPEAPFLPSLEITEVPVNSFILKAAANDGTHVLAVFGSLPYIFVFNGAHEHVHTIRFFGSDIYEHARNFIVEREGIVGTSGLWQALALLSPELLAISTHDEVYFVRIAERERFAHATTIRLSKAMADKSETEIEYAQPIGMDYHNGYLYVNSFGTPHVLRYRVDL